MKLVLASNNSGKLTEFQSILADTNLEVVPQSKLHVSEAEETGLTFIENALLKARHAAAKTGLPALADDSGLVVDALDGAPGIYSARYAGEPKSDARNIDKLLAELEAVPTNERTASFVCALVLLQHADDPLPIVCQGVWRGRILTQRRGAGGFGYDPVFFAPTQQCTAAELRPEIKNTISHRGQALQQLHQAITWRSLDK